VSVFILVLQQPSVRKKEAERIRFRPVSSTSAMFYLRPPTQPLSRVAYHFDHWGAFTMGDDAPIIGVCIPFIIPRDVALLIFGIISSRRRGARPLPLRGRFCDQDWPMP
jgi:hypothetical protein